MTIKLNSGTVTLLVDEINVNDPNSWKTVQQENYRPDRDDFILKSFKEKFPRHANAVNSIETVNNLASRSKLINNWLVSAGTEYVLEVQAPQYLKEIVEPSEYKEASEVLAELNKLSTKRSLEEQLVAKEYKDKLCKIADKYDKLTESTKKDNIVRILSLNSTSLPITLQLMIENYSPSVTSSSPDKKTYAREVLTNFKISLLKYFTRKENKDVNITEFLTEISEK